MIRRRSQLLALTLLLGVGSHVSVCAQTGGTAAIPRLSDSLVRVVDSATYQVGSVLLDKEARRITVPGWVNMQEGLVEYLAVTPDGKTHEAVLVLDVQPLHLQVALLLLGLESGSPLAYQGDSTMPDGDSVSLFVGWLGPDGDSVRVGAHLLVATLKDQSAMPENRWIFTGSYVFEGRFIADIEGSIIATYSDPAAILNNPLDTRFDDTVLGANKNVLPPRGTEVVLVIEVP